MSIVKSFSVGDGDMFYIKHNSQSFTVVDCYLTNNKENIVQEIIYESSYKDISRFISTHPDNDHICGLEYLDNKIGIINFYCVKNNATKDDETDDFNRYCQLRNSDKAFFLYRGCERSWLNKSNEEKGSGINIEWPITSNKYYKKALELAEDGESPNNISIIMNYVIEDGTSFIWMGDLEKDFMENIKNEISLPKANVLFAPHHGRKTGKVPKKWLEEMNPDIIIIGEAPSEDIDYEWYDEYNKITQNSAKDITFECTNKKIHIYVSNDEYSVDFLEDDNMNTFTNYLGTLYI